MFSKLQIARIIESIINQKKSINDEFGQKELIELSRSKELI